MIRPSDRLLVLGTLAFIGSATAVAIGGSARDAVLVIWIALAGLVVVDLMWSMRRGLDVTGVAPDEIFTGEEGEIQLSIGPGAPSGARCRFDWPDGLEGPDESWFMPGEDGTAFARLSVLARRRGLWRLDRIWLLWGSRLGFLEFMPSAPLLLEIAAVPNLRPIRSGTIDVAVRSRLFGAKENMVKGEGSEFHQLRDFTAGMDARAIDWKRSARYRGLVAKEMRAERNHQVIIALDNGFLMREELNGLPKIDHAVNAALATAWAAAVGGDLVGLFAYDHRPRRFVPPEPGRRAFAKLRRWTAELDYSSRESNHTLAMANLLGLLKRRGLIVVFSDFVDTTGAELLVENIQALSRRHVVVFVTLKDPALERLATVPAGSLDAAAASVAASDILRDRKVVLQRLTRLGIVVVDAEPGDITPKLVSTYIDLKAREVI